MQKSRNSLVLPLLCVTLICQARPTSGQSLDASFRSDIEKLFAITGAAQMGSQVASFISGQLLSELKKSQPDMPDRALAIAKEVLDAEFAKAYVEPDGFADQTISIYAKHFTHEDVRGLLAFYSTDLGKKTIASMPLILQEANSVGQQWAAKQTPRILTVLRTRLQAEGFIK